jgi:hypothetical protein
MKHKHYDVIVAWAEGKEIQVKDNFGWWSNWNHQCPPSFSVHGEYRIKSEPKPDVVKYLVCNYPKDGKWFESKEPFIHDCIKITIDGETNKLKSAEILK